MTVHEDHVGRVLQKLEDAKVLVSRSAVEIIRKTKNGYNIYTANYVVFFNAETGKAAVRVREEVGKESRRSGRSKESSGGEEW